MRPWRATAVYFLCICGALALAAIGLNLVVIGILVVGVMASLAVHTWRDRRMSTAQQADKAEVAFSEASDRSPLVTGDKKPRTKRLHFLDNAKVVLTATVVFHHCVCAFTGANWFYCIAGYRNGFQAFGASVLILNQSYFMSLFFFISGYFTPSSFDRKGRHAFVYDKLKRLGIPFLGFTFVLGPLLVDGLCGQLLIKGHITEGGELMPWSYNINAGPTWFLGWLLIFNIAYTTIDMDPVKMKRPSFGVLLGLGMLCGMVQLGCTSLAPGNLGFMPMTFGSLPFDIAFFTGGVLAKRNDWLAEPLPILPAAVLTVVLSLALIAFICWSWAARYGALEFFTIVAVNTTTGALEPEPSDPHDSWYMVWALFGYSGILTPLLSCFVLAVFQRWADFSNAATQVASQSAYTVYLIHPLTVVPLTFSFAAILEAWTGVELLFGGGQAGGYFSGTDFGGDGRVWIGFWYTAVLSQLCTWPLAYKLRQLPGLRRIL